MNNAVYKLAKDKNLLASSNQDYTTFNLVLSDGTAIPRDLADKLSVAAFEIIEGDRYKEQRANYIGSFGNFFAEKYKKRSKCSNTIIWHTNQ